jgi:hypothetical protein
MLTNPTYQQAKDAIFATATIPDGYNGPQTSPYWYFRPATARSLAGN